MGSAVIFKRIFIAVSLWICLSSYGQTDSSSVLSSSDSAVLMQLDSLYRDSILRMDTTVYNAFIPYDRIIYRNSKINLRKTLIASRNPPLRKNMNNYGLLLWAILVLMLIIFFKTAFPLQYRLLNKSWYSAISFNEFYNTQTSVFKNSRLLTWVIISQIFSMGVYTIIRSEDIRIDMGDFTLILIISAASGLLFLANQWLKSVFAFSFYQPSLSHDYAIIYRIHSYVASMFLLPVILILYYNGNTGLGPVSIAVMVVYILIVYSSSLVKFIFSGRFLQNQSNFILILYLCAFEILPLLVLIKSINNLLVYD